MYVYTYVGVYGPWTKANLQETVLSYYVGLVDGIQVVNPWRQSPLPTGPSC